MWGVGKGEPRTCHWAYWAGGRGRWWSSRRRRAPAGDMPGGTLGGRARQPNAGYRGVHAPVLEAGGGGGRGGGGSAVEHAVLVEANDDALVLLVRDPVQGRGVGHQRAKVQQALGARRVASGERGERLAYGVATLPARPAPSL